MTGFLGVKQNALFSYLILGLISLGVCSTYQSVHAQDMQINIMASSIELLSGDSVAVTIDYSLALPNGKTADISLQRKNDPTASFYQDLTGATGDIGEGITAGANKQIVWEGPNSNVVFDLILNANQDLGEEVLNEILSQIDSTRMRADLVNVEGIRHRTAGLDKLRETQELIRSRLLGYDLELREQSFPFGVYEATNFIGIQPGCGESESVWLIGGHYDTVDDSPGADDNGTAIVGMLEAARVLSEYQFKKSIAFVAWDLEEEGLIGSTNFVTRNQNSFGNIEGYMNFEMIGYFSNRANTQMFPPGFEQLFPTQEQAVANDAFRGNFIANVGNTQNSFELMENFETMANLHVPELKVISIPAPGTGAVVPDLRRSDHTPFWLADIPSIMITDSANFRNENYHGPEDVLDSLSYTFMCNVVKATVATIVEDAQPTRCVSDNVLVTAPPNSTRQIINNSALTVRPNPATNQITLQIDRSEIVENMDVRIYAADGKLVFNQSVNAATTINVDTFESGFYHLIAKGKEKTYSSKFVIQR